MTTQSNTGANASSGSGADTLALVLLVIAAIGAVVALFYKPFLIALPALVITMTGIRVSDRYRKLGMIVMFGIILGFLIGASFAVWDSRALL